MRVATSNSFSLSERRPIRGTLHGLEAIARLIMTFHASAAYKTGPQMCIPSSGYDRFRSSLPLQTNFPIYHALCGDLPMVGLGTADYKDWNAMATCVNVAFHNGVRLVDTAQNYRFLDGIRLGLRRHGTKALSQMFVICKVDLATSDFEEPEARMRRQVDSAIRKLSGRWLDAVVIHWPICLDKPANQREQAAIRRRAWKALEQMVVERRIDHLGVSNWTPELLDELSSYAQIPPSLNQVEFSPLCYQRELLEDCTRRNIAVVGYSPFGQCWLSKSYPDFVPWEPTDLTSNEVVCRIADDVGCTPGQVLLRWALQHGVAVIPKTERPERVRQARRCVDGGFKLSEEQMDLLGALRDDRRGVEASIEAHSRVIASPSYEWTPT